MTTLERLAKLAYEDMVKRRIRLKIPVRAWEEESKDLQGIWIATARSVVEGMREPVPPKIPMGKTAMRSTPLDFWQAVIDTILEETPCV